MRICAVLLIVALGVASPVFAQNPAFGFLQIDIPARASALQGSCVSMTNDPNVLFYNPASLGTMDRGRISFGYLDHLLDVNGTSLSFADALPGIGHFGLGVLYVGYGSFPATDASETVNGTFSASDLALVGGISIPFDDMTLVGLGFKYIRSTIGDYRSTAVAADLGVLVTIAEENLTIGASIQNLGTQIAAFGGTTEPLPVDVRIGVTKRPQHLPVFLNLNFHKLNEKQSKVLDRFTAFTFGAEFLMSETLRLRAGYNNEQRRELKIGTSASLAGFSLGGGLVLKDYQIDYAYNSLGNIGGLHRFSLGVGL